MNSIAIGIDLGTTNSCVAIFKDGAVKIIPNELHSNITPSWVTFASDGVYVGQKAKDEAHLYITNSIYEFKRLIGEKYNDEKIQNTIASVPYKIVNGNGIPKVEVNIEGKAKQYSPEELSSYILANLKDTAEKYIGEKIDRVVVTVPAYFNDFQRQATKNAATIAGFKIVNIINEPTAAALAYSHHNVKPYKRNVLVFDFGGGTFDVSIVIVGRGQCVVKATKGDSHLGGTDIDNNLLNYIKNDFRSQYGFEINTNAVDIRRLKNKCESVKKSLSGERTSNVIEMSMLSGKEYFTIITKVEFDLLNKDIFEKTLKITESCINDSGLSKNDINEVVLVGGSSRNLKVQAMLKEYFGERIISHGINPDEAVAYGAAIHANNLLGNKSEVIDVVSMSLGIALLDKSFSNIIPHNTPLPKSETKTYSTSSKDTSINVYQGEAEIAEKNFKLGSFILENVNYEKIEVTFEIDSEGIMKVTAVSLLDKNNARNIVINVSNVGLTSEDIEKQTKEIQEYRESETVLREFYEQKWKLEMLCELGEKKSNDADILSQCSDITRWLKNISIADKEEVDSKVTTLQNYLSNLK